MPIARRELPRLPDDPKLIAWWERKLDPKLTSIKEFCELFKVPTKRPKPGEPAMTPYRERDFQAEGRQTIEDQWKNGEGGKTLGGKARQAGETTAKLMLAWERFMRGGGGSWNYFSYDDAHSIEAFALLKKLRRQVPVWVFAYLVCQSAPGAHDGGGEWTKKSHRCLELSFPGDRGTAVLQCATAGGDFSGSGSSPRGVFLDEFTKYPQSVKQDYTGISEGWADVPGNVFAIWGTGVGNDEYAKVFTDHWDPTGRKINADGYIALFHSWLGHPDRRTEFRSPEEREDFAALVGKEKLFGPQEEKALVAAGATLEELHWRRRKLADPSFKYDLRLFSREYPLVPADMFVSESGSVFQVEILKTHDTAAAAREAAARVGDFVESDGDVVFVDNRAGSWVLYEERRDDLFVCWGADSASGKSRHAGSGKEADFSDAHFDEVYTGRTVARFRAHITGRKYGDVVLNAARYFRSAVGPRDAKELRVARGFPEVNAESGGAMMQGMERYCEERGLEFLDFVLCQEHPVLSDGKRPDPSPGWLVSRTFSGGVAYGSKGILIDTLMLYIAEVGYFDADPSSAYAKHYGKSTPFTPQFLAEAYRYERDESGRSEASTGHDDSVSSKMLASVARDYLLNGRGDLPLRSKAAPAKMESDVRRALREQDERAAKEHDARAREKEFAADGLAGY